MIISISFFILFSSLFFVYLAAIFFSISFDLMEITVTSYIMAESLPANYGQNLSYKEVAHWIWLLFGLVISAIILSASYFIWAVSDTVIKTSVEVLELQVQWFESSILVSQLIILFVLITLLWFAYIFFDKDVKVFSWDYVKTSLQVLKAKTVDWLRNSAIEIVETTLEKLKNEPNQVHLISTEEKVGIDWNEIFKDVSSSAIVIKNILTSLPRNISLIWSLVTVTLFSYWDTFLWTFLPIFFTELLRAQPWWISNVPWSLMLLIFIIPVLWLFPVFAKYWDKLWRHYFVFAWLITTWISVFLLGFSSYDMFYIFIIAWFWVWIWYVAWMSCSKADLANKINEFVAVSNKSPKIDTNASAWPIMMVNNFWNVIGPLAWGFFIDFLWFQGFFIIFWISITCFLVYSFVHYNELVRPAYVFESWV